jgi:predicted transcriptional regulator
MRTITLEVPDKLADRLETLPEGERLAALLGEDADIEPMTPEEKAAVYESLALSFADADAGRTVPAEEVFAGLRARHAERFGKSV